MFDMSRRKFFVNTSLLVLMSGTLPLSTLTSAKSVKDADYPFILKSILKEWQLKESMSPEAYLEKFNVFSIQNPEDIRDLVKSNFQNQENFEYKGFILSKLEAAVLAHAGTLV